MYDVEDRLTKMCMELVDSLTTAKHDIDKIDAPDTLNTVSLLIGFQGIVDSVAAMMGRIQHELHKDIDALLIDNK